MVPESVEINVFGSEDLHDAESVEMRPWDVLPGSPPHATDSEPQKHDTDISVADMCCFLAVAVGTQTSFIFIGGLVSYIKQQRSASFFMILYCCYYLPGLPMALLQQSADIIYDRKCGSRYSFVFRGSVLLSSVMLLTVLLQSYLLRDYAAPFLMICLGASSWGAHGSLTQLASLAGRRAVLAQQIGFQVPGLLAFTATFMWDIDESVSDSDLSSFFHFVILQVIIALAAWCVLTCYSPAVTHFLRMKDDHNYGVLPSEDRHAMRVSECTMDMDCRLMVLPLARALFVTMFVSVVTGSTYVNYESPSIANMEEVLYYQRLFCDMAGRPMVALPHPFRSSEWVIRIAIFRAVLMIVFLFVVFHPTPLPYSDALALIINFLIALLSGFNSVLAYSLASQMSNGGQQLAYIGAFMNTAFQGALLAGVICSELLVSIL